MIRLFVVMLLLLAQVGIGAAPARADTFTVNSTGDAGDANPADGICDTETGSCTLRAAIEQSNAGSSPDLITFNIPTTDPGYVASPLSFTIFPISALPTATARVTIDATTQPGFGGSPVVVVDGSLAGAADGLEIDANASAVKGLVIRDFAGAGLELISQSVDVESSYIGTDVTGSLSAGNAVGLRIRGNAARIGGLSGRGNVISGNVGHGILIEAGGGGAEIWGDRVGTDPAGNSPVPNGGDGIHVQAPDTRIGGVAAPGNTVAFNTGDGVVIGPTAGSSGSVLRNSIHSNGGLGIDLVGGNEDSYGVTANDPGDGDTGPNSLLNYPVIISALETAGVVDVDFTLDANVGSWYRIDFFRSTTADVSGHGEGATWVDRTWVLQESAGPLAGSISFNGTAGDVLTATTSRCDPLAWFCLDLDQTSEFSRAYSVGPLNNPPVLDPIGPQGGDELTLITFDANASDTDGDDYTFSLANQPSGAGIDPISGVFTWTPTEAHGPGSYDLDVIVTDDGSPGMSDTETVTVTVSEVNAAPTLDPIGDATIDELVPFGFTATATDPDVPANTLTYSLIGAPPGATIGSSSGIFSWTPSETQGPGTYPFMVSVSDGGVPDPGSSQVVTLTVVETNEAPVLNSIGGQSGDELTELSFTATAGDSDTPVNTFIFSLAGEPTGASIDPNTGVFIWTPTEVQGPGSYDIEVVVTDDGTPNRSDTETITITVTEVNRDPTVIGPGDLTGYEGEAINIAVGAWDPDVPAQSLTWSESGLPSGLGIDPTTGGITGILDRPGNVPTAHSVTVDVVDGNGGQSSTAFTWTVIPTNTPPSAADDVYSVDERGSIAVTAPGLLANDDDVEPGTLSATLLDPPTYGQVDLAPDGGFTYTHTGGDDADDSFSYILTDESGAVDTAVVTIEIIEVNNPPQTGVDIIRTDEDTPVGFSPLGNDFDPDGDPLFLDGFGQPDSGVISWSGDGTLMFSPSENFSGTTTATYTVSDGRGGKTTGTVQLVVAPVNDSPIGVADTYEFQNYLPASLAVLANDVDPDGDLLEIRWIGDVAVGSVDVEDGAILYTPQPEWSGTTAFTYTVADPDGATDIVEVSITVRQSIRRTAIALIDDLQYGAVSLAGLSPGTEQASSASLDPVQSVSLMVNAFYQTIGAFRLPLVFLGLSLAVLIGLGGVTKVPLLLAGRARTHWSVVLLGRESALQVHEDLNETSDVIYNFNPTTESILSTGKTVDDGETAWMRVHTPRGDGWVDSANLTEQVDVAEFHDDQRPPKLLKQFAEELRTGGDVTPFISERGIVLALTGPPTRLAPRQFADLLGGSRLRWLPSVGGVLHAQDDFWIAVASPFLAAFNATVEVTADTAHSKAALIPAEVWNFRYLALGEGSSQPWLVFFEYEQGKPRIVGLGIDE